MFRHERPQKGRYRQFHQIDVEAVGIPGPDVDAELIALTRAAVAPARHRAGAARDQLPRHAGVAARLPGEAGRSTSARTRARSMTTAGGASRATRCASSTARIRTCSALIARRAAAHGSSGCGVARALRGAVRGARVHRHPLPHQPAAGPRPRLLQPHGVRVDHRRTRRPGCRMLRRPLRRADRAARRRADAGNRLRDGRGAGRGAAACRPARLRQRAPRTSMWW